METQVSSTAELDEHGMGGTVHTQNAANSSEVDNLFVSEGISPTVPFTHPDASSSNGECGEGALGATLWPEHIEEGFGRANVAGDTNPTAEQNRTGHVCGPNMACTNRCTHTEREANPDTTTVPHTLTLVGAVATPPTITQELTYGGIVAGTQRSTQITPMVTP